jgi:inner membrane protein
MDTLTHALSGALVGRLLARRRAASPIEFSPAAATGVPVTAATNGPPVWQMVVAGTVAATFPDLDFVLGWVSELAYLRGHRGVTHSILLLPLWGLLIAWLLARFLGRGERMRAQGGAPSWRAFYLVVCSAIGIHIAGDLITQFGTMILAPFSDRRFGIGTTFIIDLVFTGIIVAGLLASAMWRRSRAPAAIALVLLAGWVGVGWVGRSEAIDAARAYARVNHIPVAAVDAAPRPASPFNWTAIVFDGERYHYAHINTRRSEPLVAAPDDNFIRRFSAHYQPVALAKWEVRERFGAGGTRALAQTVWNAEDFAFYRWFAMFPVLDHAERAGSGSVCANFVDLRFVTPGRDEIPFRYGLCGSDGGWHLFERVVGGRRWVAGN